MMLQTASGVISFARALEVDSAAFYETLAQRFAQNQESFLLIAGENRKYLAQIERAYYSVITDAIEGCFAFAIEADIYGFDTTLSESAGYAEALDKACRIEEKIIRFYSDAAAQARTLMADVPRAFAAVARKREGRRAKLEAMAKALEAS